MGTLVWDMAEADFQWAATLMERRRRRYVEYSPVFWRPAEGITGLHAEFMASVAARPGAVARRSQRGFIVSFPSDGRCFVDDFAVEADGDWVSEGRSLLLDAWDLAEAPEQSELRVVTARRDVPKHTMLADLGLRVGARWWVRELSPQSLAPAEWREVHIDGVTALFGPAPPVYDPGGPVCLLGDLDAAVAGTAAERAEGEGAVLAVVQRDAGPGEAPAEEPELEAAGFHNPSEFFDGVPPVVQSR